MPDGMEIVSCINGVEYMLLASLGVHMKVKIIEKMLGSATERKER